MALTRHRTQPSADPAALTARPPPLAAPALLLVIAIALGLARPAPAAEPEIISGAAAVIDGDTFRIGETVVRLYDVDAPELTQTCDGGPTRLRLCGVYVADALAERLAGREVRCTVLKLDRYDRRVARCEVEAELLTVRPVALTGVEIESGQPQPAEGEVLEEVSVAVLIAGAPAIASIAGSVRP